MKSQNFYPESNVRIRDIEEKTRLLKDRVLLIGNNLVETREKYNKDISSLKSDLELLKKDIKKIKDNMQRIYEETESFARKDDLAILERQFKMFEPLKLARTEDAKKMLNTKPQKI